MKWIPKQLMMLFTPTGLMFQSVTFTSHIFLVDMRQLNEVAHGLARGVVL